MREILFRGKQEYKNKEWAFGSLHSEYCETDENGQRKIDYRILGMRGECDYVLPETVGQFTGLTDKNGKKIFEGDIVASQWLRGVVCCGEFNCSCCDGVYGWYFDGADIREYDMYEVIGNIHDNPELLGRAEDG